MPAAATGDRLIPNDSRHDVISFDILIDGTNVSNQNQILSITVSKEVNRIPIARIMVRDGDAATENFEVSEANDFIPGKHLQIKAGRDGINTTIFKGIIVKQSLKVRQGGNSFMTVEAKDEAVKLTVGRKNRYFEDVTDSDALSEILASKAGDISATNGTHKEIVQFNATDWDFVLMRAEMNGLLVIADDGKIHIKEPSTNSSPVLNLIYGSNLLEFETEMDAQSQWASVEAKAWDASSQDFFTGDANSSGAFSEHGNLTGSRLAEVLGLDTLELKHSGRVSPSELTAWAKATMTRSRMAKIRGRAKFMGYADLKPSDTVLLRGLGARFNGKAYITAVRHELGGGTWFTHAQFGLSPEFFFEKPHISAPAAGGLLPAISGLQIGIVTQLEGDPDGEDRIQVKMPLLNNEGKGTWARLASLDAGQQRGFVFRPEVGDEVILGFLNDDPRDAVVLGQLHSSNKPAPIPATNDNHIKGWHTRSALKVLFDDEKKIITIETPAGNKIMMSEDNKTIAITDQNGNESKMSENGITLKSPKDIQIEATGDLSIKGKNIKLEAQMELSAKGSMTAKFEGGTQAVLKAATVMIN
jgi:Rhs element Vgr protein